MSTRSADTERERPAARPSARGDAEPAADVIQPGVREWITHGFSWLEDVVYIGLGLLLAGSALVLLASNVLRFGQGVLAGTLADNIVELLDQFLLVLIFAELLYTVEVSFRERVLAPEPFLIVALIAAIRRILVLTAELGELIEGNEAVFRNAMLELGLLILMIVVLVASLIMLRKRAPEAVAERGKSQARPGEER